jgi:DNA-binding transcriptional ArsR family regulator
MVARRHHGGNHLTLYVGQRALAVVNDLAQAKIRKRRGRIEAGRCRRDCASNPSYGPGTTPQPAIPSIRAGGGSTRATTELAAPFKMSLEAVSKHIQVLERAGLLRRSRRGRTHHCRISPAPLDQAAVVLDQLARLWERRLDALDGLLRELEESE